MSSTMPCVTPTHPWIYGRGVREEAINQRRGHDTGMGVKDAHVPDKGRSGSKSRT